MSNSNVRLRKILVATDFSDHAEVALHQAVDLAGRTGAEVTLAHVIANAAWAVEGSSFEAHWRIPPAELERAERKLAEQAEARLAEAVARHRDSGREVHTEVFFGVPFVEVIRAVQRDAYDLVLAGTRGLSGVKRLLVGSTAERLVRKCPCPVWVVKPGHEGPPRSILAPVDFSEVSGKVVATAGFLAGPFGCALDVLHVIAPLDNDLPVPADARWDPREERRKIREAAAHCLDRLLDEHLPPGIAVHRRLALGAPARTIAAVVRHVDPDLIVMGSVGRAGLPGVLIGNTAEKVLRRCQRPILAVKPDGFVSPVRPEVRTAREPAPARREG